MSFDTYANLQSEILAKLNRASDTDAATRCVGWITLAEDEMRMALNRLMVRQGETRKTDYSISSETNTLPTDFIRMRSNPVLTSVTPVRTLDYMTPTQMDKLDPYAAADTPRVWTLQGNMLRVFPTPSTTFTATLNYYSLPSLSVSNTSNWMLVAHPKLYFKAALAEAYDYYDNAEDREAAAMERDRMLTAISIADSSDQQGTRLIIRTDGGVS